MTAVLLDTCVLIDAERAAGSLDDLLLDDDLPAISALTIAELGVGVATAKGKRKQARQSFLDEVRTLLPVIDYDAEVADAHAGLLTVAKRAGRPRGAHDLIIAATAVATSRVIVTYDTRGFAELPGVTVRSP